MDILSLFMSLGLAKKSIPKDYIVKSAELKTATEHITDTDIYEGDKYIDFVINTQDGDGNESHIYLNVKDLVDTYYAGNGIDENNHEFSVKIDNSGVGGLTVGSGGLKLSTATPDVYSGNTKTSDGVGGAMSSADKYKLDDVAERVNGLEHKRYGVTGIELSPSALTRIFDSVGMVAEVGTDGDNSNVVNDFDNADPWKIRKCVGEWNLVDGHAVFTPNAYEGDDDYTEDGSMGDYVAVEYPRSYYYRGKNTLIISCYQHEGYKPFDIFCRNHNENDTIPYYYAPAYSLAVDGNGHAVSLPGYDNEQGSYYSLMTTARTYKNGELGTLASLMPMAYSFYLWALYTVEFAVQNQQSVMAGCSGLRNSNDDLVTFVDSTHAITNNYQAGRVSGEYVAIMASTSDVNNSAYQATHKITNIVRCDENGNADNSGTHQLLTLEDLGKGYFAYDTVTNYKLAGRPYRNGACANVSTPSGSPVNNTNGYYPMKYRHKENAFGNQYSTVADMFNIRVGTSDDDYYLEHYYLPDPSLYTPSASGKPDSTELATTPFVKLDITTPHADYVNGYIKTKSYSELYPDIWIPGKTTDASASTYYADYAFLVNSFVVRAVRLFGLWANGSYAGLSYFSGYHAPSAANAYFGGDLFFIQ